MRAINRPVLVGSLLSLTLIAMPTLSGPADASTTDENLVKTFHSNTLAGTTATISRGGNIISYLSPDNNSAGHYEHIGVGALGEGYVLCYTGPSGTVNAFDTGASASGFGAPSVVSQTASTVTTRRSTSDGKLTLTQVATFVPTERAVQIRMTLKNNTASPIANIILRRQVDFDVDTGGIDGWAGFQNWHANTTRTTAFAFNDQADAPADKEAHAMQIRFLAGPPQKAYVTTNILDSTCNADSRSASSPVFGDFGETILFPMGTIVAGGQKVAAVEYSRF